MEASALEGLSELSCAHERHVNDRHETLRGVALGNRPAVLDAVHLKGKNEQGQTSATNTSGQPIQMGLRKYEIDEWAKVAGGRWPRMGLIMSHITHHTMCGRHPTATSMPVIHTYLHEHLRFRRGAHRDHHAPPDLELRDEVDGNPLRRRPDVDGVVRPVLRPPFPPVPGLARFRFVRGTIHSNAE